MLPYFQFNAAVIIISAAIIMAIIITVLTPLSPSFDSMREICQRIMLTVS